MTESTKIDYVSIVQDLRDEADLCRNETATDIADLLDDAASCIVAMKSQFVALRAELASVKADAWRAATILAHNICIQESDRINAEDGSIEAMDAISECAKRIREWAEPSPEQLNEMLGESRAAHPKDAP